MNPNPVNISIVIPCYNDGEFLLEAIASVEQKSQIAHEIIVVNDGSTDPKTKEVLTKVEKKGHQVVHLTNGGPGRARNCGIAIARGQYILPLDADNRLRSNAMSCVMDTLDRDPSIDVVYGGVEFFGEKTGCEQAPPFDLRHLLLWNYIYVSSGFRRSTWERFGGFDEDRASQGFEDWDFWCRIACAGGNVQRTDEVLHEYRVRKNSFGAEVAAQRALTLSILHHIRSKKIQISMGKYLEAFQTWDVIVERFRENPMKTLAALVARTYFPKAYDRRKARLTNE